MPSFLDRLMGRPEPVAPRPFSALGVRSIETKATIDNASVWNRGNPLLSSWADDPQSRAAAYMRAYKVGWFYKAESKISLDIANLKRTLAPEDTAGDNETVIIEADLTAPWEALSPELQFLRLMERPNPTQTGRQLFQKTQIRLDLAGWTFWYLEGAGPVGSGQLPTAIYGISPARMTPAFDRTGKLIGWVMDKDDRGGGTPFETYEIVQFSQEAAEDTPYGQGVVESVASELRLADQFAGHQSDLLSTGGRLAGMLWPKDRTLDEAEFQDAQRAWRSVASDPNAARRLLLFPEPMEYATGAADPAAIGIPELSTLNRDNILTAFPISPYILGVPTPGGLNSGEVRREERKAYWEGTIHPRVELLEEVVQTKVVALYETVVGGTLDFDIVEPNLDDAASLIDKVAAFDALTTAGFDPDDAIEALGLDSMKWTAPAPPVIPTVNAPTPNPTVAVPAEMPMQPTPKAVKSAVTARDAVTDRATRTARSRLGSFFTEQRDRTVSKMRDALPSSKAERMKAQLTWWDAQFEDEELAKVMRGIYEDVGIGGLQAVADTLGRVIFKGATNAVIADLLEFGGERIRDINARTLQSLTVELAEGTRRGYSIPQLIDGVPDEGYKGILQAGLDNGVAVWSDIRAETIARTETMLSYNRATVTGYGEFGVTHLLAYDGDDDPECAERNGEEFTVDEALAIDDHPNGTLVWSPIVDKAVHEEDYLGREFMGLMKSLAERPAALAPDIYITNQPPDVHVAPPDVHVWPAEVNVTTPEVHVEPPSVTVNTPDVTITPPNVYVDAPIVTVQPPAITVEPSTIQVDVHIPEPKPVTKTIKRDKSGAITSIEES